MAAIAAILDFGPSPKSNGMILGPYLIPPPSFVEIRQGVFPYERWIEGLKAISKAQTSFRH